MAARPDNVNEPIPCKTMVAKDKLLAEGSLSETKMILGWLFNFRTLTVSLQNHKFIAWKAAIQKMITSKHTTSKDLDTIWLMVHQNSTIHNSQWHMHERFGVNERYSGKNKNGTYSHSERPTGCTIQICAQLGLGDTAIKGMHGIFMSQPTSNFKRPAIYWNILQQ